MTLVATEIGGVFVVEPVLMADRRGFFARLHLEDELAGEGVDTRVAQASIAYNEHAATIRGLHYQADPFGETKVVRCTAGAIFDVVADLRPGSPTLYRWVGLELSASNRRCVIAPPGCAHGYLTLSAGSEVSYLISVPYVEEAQRGVRWDDPLLDISWPTQPAVLGDRDARFPFLEA